MPKNLPSISLEFTDLTTPPFAPFVFVVTEKREPSSISMAAAAGGCMKVIDLSATITDLKSVQDMVRRHFSITGGNTALFGATIAYVWVKQADFGIVLDPHGVVTDYLDGSLWPNWMNIQEAYEERR
jgi:hypothetical protein